MLARGGSYFHRMLHDAAAATGNGVSVPCVSNQEGFKTAVGIQVSGTFSATITFEGSVDGANWVAIEVEDLSDRSWTQTATAPGLFRAVSLGLLYFRARISTYASGSVTVWALAAE